MAKTHYDDSFFDYQLEGSGMTAKEIIPVIYDVFKPQSVLDIGCGSAIWLRTFADMYKIADIRGVDGDYVKKELLKIPAEKFASYDLTKFYDAGRQFDLAMSVEVAEHIPHASSEAFVKTLVNASRKVVFSAAIPGQGGTYHVNEQYPEYWAERFAAHGYVTVDYFRKKFWDDSKVEWWYAQNIFIFIHKDELANYPQLQDAYQKTDPEFIRRIHPGMLQSRELKIDRYKNPAKNLRHHLYLLKQKLK